MTTSASSSAVPAATPAAVHLPREEDTDEVSAAVVA
jgi:hypothetical protein